MDGYWLASDLLGISNLRQATHQQYRQLWRKLCRLPMHSNTMHLNSELSDKSQRQLLYYSLFSTVFFIWFAYFLSNRIYNIVTVQLEQKLLQLNPLYAAQSSWLEIIFSSFGTIFNLLLILFGVLFFYRCSKTIYQLFNVNNTSHWA